MKRLRVPLVCARESDETEAMESTDLGVWVAPFYLQFLHANFLIERNESVAGIAHKARWREHVRHALKTMTPEIAGDLLGDEYGRVQLCGAWFCGLKRWDEMIVPLGHQLVRKERGSVTQGLSFALARMPSHASANALCGYLNRVGKAGDSTGQYREEADWVLAALQWIDAQMETHRADEYIEQLTPITQQHAFDAARQRYREAGAYCENPGVVERRRADADAAMEQFFRPYDGSEKPEWFWRIMEFCAVEFDDETRSLRQVV